LDFHEDLFPDGFGWGGIDAEEWFEGSNKTREKVSMDPAKQRPKQPDPPTKQIKADESQTSSQSISPSQQPAQSNPEPAPEPHVPFKQTAPTQYTRKFLTGKIHHPSKHFTSLATPHPSLQRLLHTTSKTTAYPLPGPGTRIVLLPLSHPGRIETPQTIALPGTLVDFTLCPFEEGVLAVVTEDGAVRVLKALNAGEEGMVEVGRMLVEGKIVQVDWHPFVGGLVGVLCFSASTSEMEFRLWDFKGGENSKTFSLPYTVLTPPLSFSLSPCV
jgi:hypothetical protein